MAALSRLSSGIRGFLAKPPPTDWLLAGAFTLAAELEVLIRVPDVPWQKELNATAALALLGLGWWRRQPLVPSIFLAVSAVASVAAGSTMPMLLPQAALFLATYALGAYAGNLALGVGAVLPVATAVAIDSLLPSPPVPLLQGLFWYVVFVTAAPILLGRLVRSRSRQIARLDRQRAALLTEREVIARHAVTAERLRISRQLHGVVIQCVDSLIADVAAVDSDRGEAGLAAVVRIETIARKALGEMRQLLTGLQRHDPAQPPARNELPPMSTGLRAEETPAHTRLGTLLSVLDRSPWPVLIAAFTLTWFEIEIQGVATVHGSRLLIDASLIGIAAPIAWSRTRPLAAAATSLLAVAAISYLLIPIPISGASAVLALYLPFSVGAFSNLPKALIGLAVCGIGVTAAYGLKGAFLFPILVGAWVPGRLLGDRTRLARELEVTNRNLAEERDLQTRQRILEDRLRMARDLHDVIGHTLTVVVLQAGAARRNWTTDRVRATRALVSLASVAREGLMELLTSLRALDDGSSPLPAIPGLGDLGTLVEQARAAGVRVALSLESVPAALSPDLELTAYRVVQEALTNVMKHAPRSAAQVRIQSRGGGLQVEVVNTGPLPTRPPSGSRGGLGLLGMAQRVAASGGELSWGRDEAGGFAVHARLPIRV